MKKIFEFIIILGIISSIKGCKEENIMLYNDNNYIQFTSFTMDSTIFSFLGFPNDDKALYPLEVEVVGFPSNKDREYKVVVVNEYSNATNANYVLPEKFIVKAGSVIDTCWITLKKTPELSKKALRLAVKLEDSADFRLGQSDKLGQIIWINNIISKPNWWTLDVITNFLGNYSDEKFRLFIEVTGVADFDSSNLGEMRAYAVMFKNYLHKEKEANRTVLEKDGTEMIIPFFGN